MTPGPDLLPARADSRSHDALLAFAETALAIEGIALDQRSLRQIARAVGRLRPATDQADQASQAAPSNQPTTALPPSPAGPEGLDAAFAALLQACR